jgi:hypothetical protein
MRQTVVTALVLLLVSSTAQATGAMKHRHVRTTDRAAAYEQWRNSNAYIPPGDTSPLSNGAMASGIAGH